MNYTDEQIEELQTHVLVDLQKIVSLYQKADFDPFTTLNFINQISKIMMNDLKREYKKMSKDFGKFEAEVKSDLEKLSESIEE